MNCLLIDGKYSVIVICVYIYITPCVFRAIKQFLDVKRVFMHSAALFIARNAGAPGQLKEAFHTILIVTWLRNLLLLLILLIEVALFRNLGYSVPRVSVAELAHLAPVDVRFLIADRAWTVIFLIGNHGPFR